MSWSTRSCQVDICCFHDFIRFMHTSVAQYEGMFFHVPSFVRPPLPSSPLPIVGTAPARPPLLSVQKATACTPILSPTHALSASSFRSRESSPPRPCPPSPPPRSPRRRPRCRRSVPGRPCPSPLHLHRPRRRPPRAAAAHEAIAFAQPLSAHPRLRSPIAPSPSDATRRHPGPVRLWPVDRN